MTDNELLIKIKADSDRATKDIARLSKEVDKLTKENKKFGTSSKEIEKINKSFNSLGNTIKGIAAAYLSFEGARKLITTTADIEKGFLGVAKTTGITGDELEKLKGDILDLSTELAGVSIEGLQSVAETAGQLGIQGQENILKFTEVITKMGTATDLSAEEAAVAMAKLGNSLDVPVDKFENIGSVINELSNTTTATAKDLVDVGQRIAGAGKSFGLTATEILGLSATLKDVGLSSEIAGTAVSKVLIKMLTDTKSFADAVGLSFETFSEQLKTEPIAAVESFLEALGRLDKEAKLQALVDLKLTGGGVAQTLLKLSSNTQALSKNLKTAGDEWERNTSLQKEYETAAQGLDAQFERAKNAIQKLAFEIGEKLLPKLKLLIDEFVKWVDGLDEARLQEFADDIASMASVIADVVTVLGQFAAAIGSVIALNPQLFAGLVGIVGVMKVLNGLLPGITTGLLSMGAGAAGLAGASAKTTTAVSALGTTIRAIAALAGPWGVAFAAMGTAAVVAIDAYTESEKKANAATRETTQELENHSAKMQSISDMYMQAQTQMDQYGAVSYSTREKIRTALEAERVALENSILALERQDTMTKQQEQSYYQMAESLGVVKASLDTLDATYTVDFTINDEDVKNAANNIEQEDVTIDVEVNADGLNKDVENAKKNISDSSITVGVDADTSSAEAKIGTLKKPTGSQHTVKPDASRALATIDTLKRPTSSVHTIYERVVPARANGGPIPYKPLQRLAIGGTFTGSGRVPGYDPTDSDKVNAKLTGGEFVVKREAVKAIGLKALYDINNMRLKIPQLPRFATGGLVGSTTSSTVTAQQLTPINLNIGGQSFGVMSDRDVAEALQRYFGSEGGL